MRSAAAGEEFEVPVKINAPHTHHAHEMGGAATRHAAKAGRSADASRDTAAPVSAPAVSPAAPGPSAGTVAAPSAPTESTVDLAVRKLPPGLVRVAARLEALGAEGRNAGQSNALTQITRNLQRYTENQGVPMAPAPLPDPQATPLPVPVPPQDGVAPLPTAPNEAGVASDATPEAPARPAETVLA